MTTMNTTKFLELAGEIMGEATHEYPTEVDGALGTVWTGNNRSVYGFSQNQPVEIVVEGKGGTEVIRPCE